jgi:hypothetical protein
VLSLASVTSPGAPQKGQGSKSGVLVIAVSRTPAPFLYVVPSQAPGSVSQMPLQFENQA